MQLQEQVFWEASPEGMGIKQVPALDILGAGHDGVLFFRHMLQNFYESITPPDPAGRPNVVPPSLFPETWWAGRMNLH